MKFISPASLGATALLASTVSATCPTCWVTNPAYATDQTASECIPDPNKVSLTCSGTGMNLSIEKCVMGETRADLLTVKDNQALDTCSTGPVPVTENAAQTHYEASVSLDCSENVIATGADNKDYITFSQELSGIEDSNAANALLSFVNKNLVGFSCKFPLDYEVSDDYVVEAAVTGGTTTQDGLFTFELRRYTDSGHSNQIPDTPTDSTSVGSTMYFGIVPTGIAKGLLMTATECTVTAVTDTTLTYNLMENSCPQDPNLTEFAIVDNSDSAQLRFSYKVFEFRGHNDRQLRLSCKLNICDANKADSICKVNETKNCSAVDSSKEYLCRNPNDWPNISPHSRNTVARQLDVDFTGNDGNYKYYHLRFGYNSYGTAHQAKKACQVCFGDAPSGVGHYVFHPTSQEEMEAVGNAHKNTCPNLIRRGDECSLPFWIQGYRRDISRTGPASWPDFLVDTDAGPPSTSSSVGGQLSYTNFASNLPNDSAHCICARTDSTFSWNSFNCGGYRNVICKVPASVSYQHGTQYVVDNSDKATGYTFVENTA